MKSLLIRCTHNHNGETHDWEIRPGDPRVCPKCGNTDLCPLVRIHLLVKDPKGPIVGKLGRYYVACDPAMRAIEQHVEAWTEDIRAVNCPECRQSKAARTQKEAEAARQFYASGGLYVPSDYEPTKPTPVPELVSPPADNPHPAPAPLPTPTQAEELPITPAQQ